MFPKVNVIRKGQTMARSFLILSAIVFFQSTEARAQCCSSHMHSYGHFSDYGHVSSYGYGYGYGYMPNDGCGNCFEDCSDSCWCGDSCCESCMSDIPAQCCEAGTTCKWVWYTDEFGNRCRHCVPETRIPTSAGGTTQEIEVIRAQIRDLQNRVSDLEEQAQS